MANEIISDYPSGGSPLYFRIRGMGGKVAIVAGASFEAWNSANVGQYGVAMVDKGGGMHVGDIPTWIKALNGTFKIQVCVRAGEVQAITDKVINSGQIQYYLGRERTRMIEIDPTHIGGL